MRRSATLALVLATLVLPTLARPPSALAEGESRATQMSSIAPLAPRSLLLGATTLAERVVAVGERGHVLLSTDRGVSWRQIVVPTRVTLTAVHAPSSSHAWAVGHDAVILHSADGGESWTRQYADPELESPLLDVFFLDPKRGFAVGAYRLFLETRDGGQSWQSRTISDRDVHHNAITATPDGSLFVAGEMGSLFRSRDRGESWDELESPQRASFFGALGLPDGGLLLFGLRGRVFRSNDGGDSWRQVETDTGSSLMGGAVTAKGEVVLGGINGLVLVSRSHGKDFASIRRSDRKAVATATALPGHGVLVFGAFGVADGSALLTAGPPDTWQVSGQ
jgi:photosystem II stability/assembly factor-like uncharacterized protein